MRRDKLLGHRILSELMKNSKSSDRQIAKKLGVSQPTVTRRRAKLEKELSLLYTTIPNWEKLGFRIIAFTLAKWKHRAFPKDRMADAKEYISKNPSVIFASCGQGLNSDRICISFHGSYREYQRFKQEIRQHWSEYVDSLDSFIVGLGADEILKQWAFSHLAEKLEEIVKD